MEIIILKLSIYYIFIKYLKKSESEYGAEVKYNSDS